MNPFLRGLLGVIVGVLACVGVVALLFFSPFSKGTSSGSSGGIASQVAQGAGAAVKEKLRTTPDDQLEKEAEFFTQKMYPIVKGVTRGLSESLMKDAEAPNVSEKAYEAGRDVTRKAIAPFLKGIADGSSDALREADRTLQEVRSFQERNREVIDTLGKGLEVIDKLKGILPPPPGFSPGAGPFPRPRAPGDGPEPPFSQYPR
jgi:hypothetical protein